ncbi:ThiF family adenylyltransferase [Dactylosporangium sp. CA-152071]|uniref:ThiF family adenylyltransferase n=1 Tax=Dactylosporangium sp. CA-152071 TaxID=3239933 RepID=UPI003D8F251E
MAGSDADGQAVLDLLDRTPIRVILPQGTPQWRHQVLALALVDLLGRLFPNLTIAADRAATAHPDLPPGPALLTERLHAAATNGALLTRGTPDRPTVTVIIGTGTRPDNSHGSLLYTDGGGWQSYNGTLPSRLPDGPWPAIPVGPLAAACRAAGQATTAALTTVAPTRVPEPSAYASALTHVGSADPIDDSPDATRWAGDDLILDAALAGAGSVGGAAVYTFAMTPHLSGRLAVADPQRLEDKNLDRALLATAATATARHWKVFTVKQALGHHDGLHVDPHQGTLSDWVANQPWKSPLPLVLSAVDSAAARRSLQDCLPLDLVNAACHPDEITVSGHRTGDGPCLCCLHMEQILDADNAKIRILARATGFDHRTIAQWLVGDPRLQRQVLRQIERHRGLAPGALDRYENQTLEHLRAGELLYGASELTTATGTVAVAAPFVTALAGVLLAAEALKHAHPGLRPYRLGPTGTHIKYEENRHAGPLHALHSIPARWATSECLCRSTRRQRLIAARYGLPAAG